MIVWSTALITGQRSIDIQHQELIETIAELQQQVDSGCSMQSLLPLMQSLHHYVLFHFAHEEALMRRAAVPAEHSRTHLAQHAEFAGMIDRTLGQLTGGGGEPTTAHALLEYLQSWLVNHIKGTDRTLVRWLGPAVLPAQTW